MLKKQFLVITLFLINTTMFAMNDNPPAAAHSERTTIGEQTLYSERTTINTPNITSNQNTYNINNGPNLTGKKFSENLVFNAAAVIANAGAEGIVKGAYDAAVNVAVILTVDMLKKNVLPESADERNIREFVMKNTKIENLSKLGERINKYSRRAEDEEELRPQAEQLRLKQGCELLNFINKERQKEDSIITPLLIKLEKEIDAFTHDTKGSIDPKIINIRKQLWKDYGLLLEKQCNTKTVITIPAQ